MIYAVAKLGAVSVVLDIKWKPREMMRALRFFDCRLLLYDDGYDSGLTAGAARWAEVRGFFLGRCRRFKDKHRRNYARSTRTRVPFRCQG